MSSPHGKNGRPHHTNNGHHTHHEKSPSKNDSPPNTVHWSSTKKLPQQQFSPPDQRPLRRHKEDQPDCVPVAAGVKTVAFCSVLLGIGVIGVCGWVLHRSIQDWRNPTLVTANNLLSQVNTFFGGTTGLYDLDVIYRILTSCSATGFVGGVVQFFLSLWLLLATQVNTGRTVAKIWTVAAIFIMCSIGGACLCILTNELQISTPITIFLSVTGANFLLLIPFAWVVFMYGAQRDTHTYV